EGFAVRTEPCGNGSFETSSPSVRRRPVPTPVLGKNVHDAGLDVDAHHPESYGIYHLAHCGRHISKLRHKRLSYEPESAAAREVETIRRTMNGQACNRLRRLWHAAQQRGRPLLAGRLEHGNRNA